MGAAYFIVLEKNIDGLDTGMDGKSLTSSIKQLDKLAKKHGVKPLSEFFSLGIDGLSDLLGEDELGDLKLPDTEHFSPAEGLKTIRTLLEQPLPEKSGLIEDLKDCERILTKAEEQGVRWHLEMDV
jgi:hypothetical protein